MHTKISRYLSTLVATSREVLSARNLLMTQCRRKTARWAKTETTRETVSDFLLHVKFCGGSLLGHLRSLKERYLLGTYLQDIIHDE